MEELIEKASNFRRSLALLLLLSEKGLEQCVPQNKTPALVH